jgi:hypothetical protein
VGKRTCWVGYLRLNACNKIKAVGEREKGGRLKRCWKKNVLGRVFKVECA